jgi:2-methylcitrate dehydratase PrpD
MKKNLTDELAIYTESLSFESLGEDVVESAKLFILDFVLSAMAGYKINKSFGDSLVEVYSEMGGNEQSSVMFYNKKLSTVDAAFLNAAFGHGADIDDGHRSAQGHPGVVTIPAVLALAEAYSLKGKDIITAVVAGYEFFIRFGQTVNPYHVEKGFHTTGTIGTIAAGAAAAKVLGLSTEQIKNTLGFSCMQASGLLEVVESNQMAKVVNPGKAAASGVFSALLAKTDVKSPVNVIEGRKGFLNAFAPESNYNILTEKLGTEHKIKSAYIKPYPSCRHAHGAIDAAMNLRQKEGFTISEIERINIYVYPTSIKITGNIFEPKNVDEAKFSLKYNLAVALTKGGFTLKDLDVENKMNDDILTVIRKSEIISDDSLENRELGIRGARVEIILKDGSTSVNQVNLPKGDPETQMTNDDMLSKMSSCAEGMYDKKRQMEIFEYINKIDEVEDVRILFELLKLN